MKSKSILQMKPELIVVALLMMFLLSGTAVADINPPSIGITDMGDHLHKEVVTLFWIVILIMCAVGALLIACGGASYKAKASGYVIITGCVAALIIFYVLPGIITDVKDISTTGNNTTST